MESKPKTYTLATLRAMCGDQGLKQTLPWHDLRDGGLWLADREPLIAKGERDVMQWHPRQDLDRAALPVPFTAYELAAFFLAGGGLFLYEIFDDGESLDEDALNDLGSNAGNAREALRDAHQLWMLAADKFGRDDEGVRKSADWLLNDAHQELTAQNSEIGSVPMVAADAAHIDAEKVAAIADSQRHEPEAGRTVHELKQRADPLAAFIKQARAAAADPADWTNVWAAMVVIAQKADRLPPLLGYIEGEGVKYQTDNAEAPVGWLTRDAWRKRASRAT